MKKRLSIIIILLTFCVFVFINNFVDKYTLKYTKVIPYASQRAYKEIAPAINILRKRLDSIKSSLRKKSNIKIVYQLAFGSGFLEKNLIGNDLDYAIGVHLGKIKVKESKEDDFVDKLFDRLEIFTTTFYDEINKKENSELSTSYDSINYILGVQSDKNYSEKILKISLENVLARKDYQVVYLDRDKKPYFPLKFTKNELFLLNYPTVQMFSNKIKYTKSMYQGIREVSIKFSLYCDIEYEKQNGTKELLKNITIDVESQPGSTIPMYKHFFASNVFIGDESIEFLKNFPLLKEEKRFFSERFDLFKRSLLETKIRAFHPEYKNKLKALKRLHQTTDLIAQILEEDEKLKIYSFIEKNLYNKKFMYLNDINTLGEITAEIWRSKNLFEIYKKSGALQSQIEYMIVCVDKSVENFPDYKTELKNIKAMLKEILFEIQQPKVNSHKSIRTLIILSDKAKKLLAQLLPESAEYEKYIRILNSKLYNLGYRPLNIYWFPDGSAGIYQKELKKYLEKTPDSPLDLLGFDALPNMQIRYIDNEPLKEDVAFKTYWLRFSPDKAENERYKSFVDSLTSDRSRFTPKTDKVFVY